MKDSPTHTSRNRSKAAVWLTGVVTMALIGTACGGGSASDHVAELETVRAEAASDIEAAHAEGADATAELESMQVELQTQLTELEGQAASQAETIDELTSDLAASEKAIADVEGQTSELEEALTKADARADEAEDRVQELLNTYDAEIRADAQIAWDAEIARACQEAGSGSSSISSYVGHTAELAVIGTGAELVTLVTECAEPLRARSEEERLNTECERGSVDAVTKDPDGLAGECYVMYVVPWQWDSRTGPCNFLGAWDGSNLGTRRYLYDGDGLFQAGPDVCAEDLGEADQDDLLQIWATLNGAYHYDTAAGGTNEIPDFTIERAVLVAKA